MTDQRYTDYIKINKGKFSDESIAEGLRKAGVPQTQIDDAFAEAGRPPAAPAYIPPPPPNPEPAARQAAPAQVSSTARQSPPAASQAAGPQSGTGATSHESKVRHSYPVAAADSSFMTALGLFMRTSPFVLARLAILIGFTLASIVWFIVVMYAGAILSRVLGGLGGLIALVVGLGLPAAIFAWLKKYMLYMLKLAHIAALTRFITHGSMDSGENQVEYGKRIVAENFAQANIMFALDSIIDGVVGSFLSSVNWLANLLPIPGMSGFMEVFNRLMRNATTYIDETIFSYNIARGDENKWRSSRDGLVYYAQNWKPVMKTAVYALVLEYMFSFAAFLIFTIPLGIVARFFPVLGGWFVLAAILLALNIRSAVLHPLMMTMVALTFHKAAQGQEIDPGIDATLSSVSEKFVELSKKAREWNASGTDSLKQGVGAALPSI
jgi:hypothetical protein